VSEQAPPQVKPEEAKKQPLNEQEARKQQMRLVVFSVAAVLMLLSYTYIYLYLM